MGNIWNFWYFDCFSKYIWESSNYEHSLFWVESCMSEYNYTILFDLETFYFSIIHQIFSCVCTFELAYPDLCLHSIIRRRGYFGQIFSLIKGKRLCEFSWDESYRILFHVRRICFYIDNTNMNYSILSHRRSIFESGFNKVSSPPVFVWWS